jgi:hypothetical protein
MLRLHSFILGVVEASKVKANGYTRKAQSPKLQRGKGQGRSYGKPCKRKQIR